MSPRAAMGFASELEPAFIELAFLRRISEALVQPRISVVTILEPVNVYAVACARDDEPVRSHLARLRWIGYG